MLYDGTARVEIPEDPGYHLTEDLTNQAINWMRFQHAMTPEKPIFVYFATGAVHAPHHISPEWADRSSGIIAEVDIPEGGANGVILAQGGRFGGWALYMKDGKPAYTYNWLGLKSDTIMASEPLPAGKATITFDFDYDGGGLGKGGNGKIRVNGKTVAEGRIEQTQSNMFSLDESADVGVDEATPVVEGIGEGQATRFTGTINQVTLELR